MLDTDQSLSTDNKTDSYEQDYYSLIEILARMCELHSPGTGEHSRRVTTASEVVAIQMNMTIGEIREIRTAALLHDIGKISIPEHILKKDLTSLSNEEKSLLYEHPVIGEETLKPVSRLENVRKIIRHHHEAYNGKGWPDKLSGSQIPIGSRIVAVVNTYDKILNLPSASKMTSRKDMALTHLHNNINTLYDPDVVEIFIDYIDVSNMIDDEIKETSVHLTQLREGMVLSQDLRTSKGFLIIARDTKIGQRELERINHFNRISQITNTISVYQD